MAFAAQAAQALSRSNLYASEQQARARAEDTARQLRRINRVAAALARSNDVTEICRIVTVETHQALGAAVTALCLLEDNATLRVVEIQGATPQTRAKWKTFPLSANLPASETVRLNQPVIIDSRADLEAQYPDLAGQAPHDHSLLCVPLSTKEGPLGALSVSFHPEAVDGGLIETLTTLASQCAIALDRALLSQKGRGAADAPPWGLGT
jgi:GAF domain-containing protein